MIPASFDESNAYLDAPPDMPDVEPLSVLRGEAGSEKVPVVVSCWKVTAEELAEINRTGRVWLTVVGGTMPPVCVDGIKPVSQ